MKLIGALILVFAALLLIRLYKKYVDVGVRQAHAFFDLLVGLKRQISVSGTPVDRFISGYKSELLSELGFFSEYEKMGSLSGAFFALGKRLFIPREIGQAIGRIFDGIGRGTLSGEVKGMDDGAVELKKMITEYQSEAERSVRCVSVVTVAAALGLLIILV